MENLNLKQKIIFITIISVMIFVIAYYFFNKTKKEEYENSYIVEDNENINENENEYFNNTESTNQSKVAKEKEEIILVHVAGQVNMEGIVELKKGQRISDAIEKAGGVNRAGRPYKSKFSIHAFRWTKNIYT